MCLPLKAVDFLFPCIMLFCCLEVIFYKAFVLLLLFHHADEALALEERKHRVQEKKKSVGLNEV